MNRIFLLSIVCFHALLHGQSLELSGQPNIILIMADDLGYGDLSCYGNRYHNTPNIDALAQEGVRLLDFHSNGPVCSPTRAALITGKYQQRVGVTGVLMAKGSRKEGVAAKEITMAEEMQRLGYTTGMFGKWHCGYLPEMNPNNQGFEMYRGFISGNVDYHSHVDLAGNLDWWNNTKVEDEVGYTTDLITKYSVNFIKNNHPKKTGKPFFMYVPHEAPHAPYQRRIDRALREIGKASGTGQATEKDVKSIYKEMVEVMDEGIGQIVKTLKDEGLYSNTMLVFCSDNGANKGDNGILKGGKGSLYEGGHRVPGIVVYPNKIKKGTVSNLTMLTMDLMPTFIDLAKGIPSIKLDGISLKDELFEGKEKVRDVFWAYKKGVCIRNGDWKLMRFGESYLLFNLKEDLKETQDVSEQNLEKVNQLKTKLTIWENTFREVSKPRPTGKKRKKKKIKNRKKEHTI